jgi:hypothetical protein
MLEVLVALDVAQRHMTDQFEMDEAPSEREREELLAEGVSPVMAGRRPARAPQRRAPVPCSP